MGGSGRAAMEFAVIASSDGRGGGVYILWRFHRLCTTHFWSLVIDPDDGMNGLRRCNTYYLCHPVADGPWTFLTTTQCEWMAVKTFIFTQRLGTESRLQIFNSPAAIGGLDQVTIRSLLLTVNTMTLNLPHHRTVNTRAPSSSIFGHDNDRCNTIVHSYSLFAGQ